ncbi:hypothetical protein NQ314_000142 [Rhamnusium bicolor]|uniref:Major facilitator superfamily (MFS) profile domain-containing protein n=1 Tax=Rhamnusium bicolor TaxID=1586634 RepID=A0AAV8ZYA6_9CUCU|nr:hypothetical protein NQ314_000142 [Rhamnusium bicolor]
MENICFCCKAETDQHKLIKCCVCKNDYKHTCVGLTLNDVKTISNKSGLSFTCTNCAIIGKDINELKALIAELKNEVTQLKLQKSVSSQTLSNDTFEEVVQEAKQETEHLILRVKSDNQHHQKTNFRTMFQPEVVKPFIIINVFNTMQILSGTYIIVFYAVDILSHVQGVEHIDHFLAAVLTACVRFIFTIIASFLLVLIGRRTLAMISGLGTAISALCLGTFLHQNCQGNDYVSALLVLIYVATNTVGFMILPGVMLGELFPAKIRGLAGGLTFMLFNFILFGVAKVFPFVRGIVGVSGVFWIFGISSLIASMFLYLTLPETKSKTLSQIEDYFHQENFFVD